MKVKKLILFLPFLLFLSCSHHDGKKVATSGELMWKIEKEGLPGASYLYGTIHLMPADEFFMPQDAVDALKASKSLVLEADIDMSVKEQIALAKKMVMPAGKTYQDYMPKEIYDALYSYLLDSVGIKEARLERYFKLKPFYLLGIVLKENYQDVVMYEQEFSKLAQKNDIPLNELEGVEYQINLIDSTGLSMVFPTLDELSMIPDFEHLMELYKTKNLNSIYSELMSELDTTDVNDKLMEDLLFKRRNNEWIPKIEKLVADQPVFIAVGCGHLAGDYGIVNKLKQKGYTLTPMPF